MLIPGFRLGRRHDFDPGVLAIFAGLGLFWFAVGTAIWRLF